MSIKNSVVEDPVEVFDSIIIGFAVVDGNMSWPAKDEKEYDEHFEKWHEVLSDIEAYADAAVKEFSEYMQARMGYATDGWGISHESIKEELFSDCLKSKYLVGYVEMYKNGEITSYELFINAFKYVNLNYPRYAIEMLPKNVLAEMYAWIEEYKSSDDKRSFRLNANRGHKENSVPLVKQIKAVDSLFSGEWFKWYMENDSE